MILFFGTLIFSHRRHSDSIDAHIERRAACYHDHGTVFQSGISDTSLKDSICSGSRRDSRSLGYPIRHPQVAVCWQPSKFGNFYHYSIHTLESLRIANEDKIPQNERTSKTLQKNQNVQIRTLWNTIRIKTLWADFAVYPQIVGKLSNIHNIVQPRAKWAST